MRIVPHFPSLSTAHGCAVPAYFCAGAEGGACLERGAESARRAHAREEAADRAKSHIEDLSRRSRQDRVHDASGYVGQPEVAPLVAVGKPLVVDA